MFKLRGTIVIALLLFIPFGLKMIGFEPFPAIVFPSGGITIKNVDHSVNFESTALFAKAGDNTWKEIDQDLFMKPLPVHFIQHLADRDFGLNKTLAIAKSRRTKILKKIKFLNVGSNHKSEALNLNPIKTTEVRNWIRQRLALQHFAGTEIKVVTMIKTISVQTGLLLKTKIKNERVISFNE